MEQIKAAKRSGYEIFFSALFLAMAIVSFSCLLFMESCQNYMVCKKCNAEGRAGCEAKK